MNRVGYIVSLARDVEQGIDDARPHWLKALVDGAYKSNRFLYELPSSAPYHRGGIPELFCTLEIGTGNGTSALNIAAGANQHGRVLTIDSQPSNVEKLAAEHGLGFYIAAMTEYEPTKSFDVLLISTDSDTVYPKYRGSVRPGGFIIVKTPESTCAWDQIEEPKIAFPEIDLGIAFVG
jgi:hypothetical protein